MFRLIDKDGKPTEHTALVASELVKIAESLWGDEPFDMSDEDELPNGWRIEAEK